jgi:hypothetical protein
VQERHLGRQLLSHETSSKDFYRSLRTARMLDVPSGPWNSWTGNVPQVWPCYSICYPLALATPPRYIHHFTPASSSKTTTPVNTDSALQAHLRRRADDRHLIRQPAWPADDMNVQLRLHRLDACAPPDFSLIISPMVSPFTRRSQWQM